MVEIQLLRVYRDQDSIENSGSENSGDVRSVEVNLQDFYGSVIYKCFNLNIWWKVFRIKSTLEIKSFYVT